MSKEARLNETDREKIALTYQQFSINVKAELVRQTASKLAGRHLGLSTVQRELVALRKQRREIERAEKKGEPLKPIDKTWSIGSLADCQPSAEPTGRLSLRRRNDGLEIDCSASRS